MTPSVRCTQCEALDPEHLGQHHDMPVHGVEVTRTGTESAHAPECDGGDGCINTCPIPVPVPIRELEPCGPLVLEEVS